MPYFRPPSRYQIRMWLLSLGMLALALLLLGGLGWGALALWRYVRSPVGPTVASVIAVTPVASVIPPTDVNTSLIINDPALEQTMLAAINANRQSNGLAPVAWDATAATAGATHAADMAARGYFSHWSPDGYGPEMRYTRAGGTDTTMENISTSVSHYSDGRPVPIDNFTEQVLQAEARLMQSSGHRRNILMPSHTHVGVGFAYNPQTGSFYLVQEFVDRYVEMQPIAQTGQISERITVVGRLLPGAEAPLINLTYAPFPQPMSLDELNSTGSYQRDAKIYAPLTPHLVEDGTFSATTPLDYKGQPGIYSIRVWVTVDGEQVLASEQVVVVHS